MNNDENQLEISNFCTEILMDYIFLFQFYFPIYMFKFFSVCSLFELLLHNGLLKVTRIKRFSALATISLLFSNLAGSRIHNSPLILDVNPASDHSYFIVEKHIYKDADFWVYYPMYFFAVEMVVYDDQVIWDWEENQNANFCYAILNYKYKLRDVLFSYVVKVTQSHLSFVKLPCPDLEEELENSYERLKFLHENYDSILHESSQGHPIDSLTTDDEVEVFSISPPSLTEPVVETGETTTYTERNNLSQPVANNEGSQIETEEHIQLDDQSEPHNIHSEIIINGLYP